MNQIARREYPPIVTPCPVTELPFVDDIKIAPRKKARSFWAVERTADYGMACEKGREYAAHYLQYLKQRPDGRGLLGRIACSMRDADALGSLSTIRPREDGDRTHGYAVGFFAFLDSILMLAMDGADPFAILQMEVDLCAELAPGRARQGAAPEVAE